MTDRGHTRVSGELSSDPHGPDDIAGSFSLDHPTMLSTTFRRHSVLPSRLVIGHEMHWSLLKLFRRLGSDILGSSSRKSLPHALYLVDA